MCVCVCVCVCVLGELNRKVEKQNTDKWIKINISSLYHRKNSSGVYRNKKK